MRVEALVGGALDAALDDVAALRIAVFRDCRISMMGTLDMSGPIWRRTVKAMQPCWSGRLTGQSW
mgnify:CR=1 FL=1